MYTSKSPVFCIFIGLWQPYVVIVVLSTTFSNNFLCLLIVHVSSFTLAICSSYWEPKMLPNSWFKSCWGIFYYNEVKTIATSLCSWDGSQLNNKYCDASISQNLARQHVSTPWGNRKLWTTNTFPNYFYQVKTLNKHNNAKSICSSIQMDQFSNLYY